MKKTKKLLAGLALAAMLLTTGCNSNANPDGTPYRQQDVYQLFKKAGGKMTYDEWLATIRGADGSQFYADAGDPNNDAGKDGDMYVNLENWNLFLKVAGSWRNLFCLKGEQGEQGPQGPQGPQGDQGIQGEPGSQIYADGQDPVDGGKEGDVFFNIETWDVFMKLNGQWQKIGNIKGADGENGLDGANGNNIYADGKDPTSGGREGDVFFNIATWDVFMKLNGQWQKIGNVKGEQGVSVLHGAGRPGDWIGRDGDGYIDYMNGNFYSKSNGHWVLQSNMVDNSRVAYSAELQAEMIKYVGTVLPFADFSNEGFYHRYVSSYEYYYGFGVYVIGDDNPYNIFDGYEQKLLAAGFEYNPSASIYGGDYIYQHPRGYQVEVSFNWFEASDNFAAGNEIDVYMPPYVEPYSAEYFLANDFVQVNGWPEANVATTMDDVASFFTGYNNDGVFYERFDKYNASTYGYYRDFIATEGNFVEAINAQAAAAGFEFDEDYECWLDDEEREIDVEYRDGWTVVKFFGKEVEPDPYDEAYFLDNGFTKSEGYPTDVVASAYLEANRFGPIAENADWYYKVSTTEYTSGAHIGTTRTTGYLYTAGDVTEEMIAAVLAAGFVYVERYQDYELPSNDMAYLYIRQARGYSYIQFNGDYIPTGEVIELPRPDEINDKIPEVFAALGIEGVTAPEFVAADADAYYEYSSNTFRVYKATLADMQAYEGALSTAGWQINHYSTYYPDDFKAYFPNSNACMDIEEYSTYVYIRCMVEAAPVPPTQYSAAEASALMVAFFDEAYDLEVEVADYPFASDEGYFLMNTDYLQSQGVLVFDAYKSDTDDLDEFAIEMGLLDWELSYDAETGSYLMSLENGATVEAFPMSNGVIRIGLYFVAPPSTSFPNAQVNAFLTSYQLGFTISDEVAATMPGSLFNIGNGSASGYAYFYVQVEGNYEAEYLAILDPILVAAGYTLKTDSSGSQYYANAVDHQISVHYYADKGYTQILFFEQNLINN